MIVRSAPWVGSPGAWLAAMRERMGPGGLRGLQILRSGVKSVQNDLQVVPEVAVKRVEKRDDQLHDAVQKQLESRAALKDDKIDVEVKNGVVRLTGTVDGFGERMTALTVARSTDGVKSVIDDLRIEKKG